MTTRTPADLVVVGGGVIGLAVAWRAAAAGLAVAVVDPDPGHGASWAAAGMLAPVGEAHFGEDALARLNVAAARAWPAFARDLEEASGRPVDYQTGGHPAGGRRPLRPGGRRRRPRVPAGPGAHRPSTDLAAVPGRRAPAGSGDPGRGRTRRRPPGGQPPGGRGARRRLPAGSVSFVDDEVAEVTTDTLGVTGVILRSGRRLVAGPWSWPPAAARARWVACPDGIRPPVRPVKGLTVRLRAAGGRAALWRGRSAGWCTGGAATWCRGGTGPSWSGPPSRRRAST